MQYQPGDKIRKEHMNSLIALLGDGFKGVDFTTSSGDIVQTKRVTALNDVVIKPVQLMPKYSAYVVTNEGGLQGFQYDDDTKKPVMSVTKADVQSSGEALLVTNGSIELQANQKGYGHILREGEFAWIQADENCNGVCGIDPSTGKLKMGWPGFISGGHGTVDGVLCAYVTRYRGIEFGKAVSGGGGQWSMINVTLYKTNWNVGPPTGPWAAPPLTTCVVKAINIAPSTVSVGGTCLLLPHRGLYLSVEVC
jgi:hypothetical protein